MGSKADILLGFGDFFDHPIEGRAHAVWHVASVLHKADAWFVLLKVGHVNCLAFCAVGIDFGQVGTFVLCYSNAVIKKQAVTLAQSL